MPAIPGRSPTHWSLPKVADFYLMLPTSAITEYKEIYRKKYGVKLSDEEAFLKAHKLFNLMKAVLSQSPIGQIGFDEQKYNEIEHDKVWPI